MSNDNKNLFMFSGQGSHYYDMGKTLYQSNNVFKKWMHTLDDIAIDYIGEPVLGKIYDPGKKPMDVFDRTLFTHPAIFMTEYALAKALIDRGIACDMVLGASLGEFCAACIAGIMSVETGLELVIKQAEVLEETCQDGGMLAVLGDPALYNENALFHEKVTLAGVNYASHFVVAGDNRDLDNIETFLKSNEYPYQRLAVSQGFHSPLINPARDAYTGILADYSFKKPTIPFVSCCAGKKLEVLDNKFFWNVVCEPINFKDAVLHDCNKPGINYIDVGPSGTLATFVKYLLGDTVADKTFQVLTPFKQDIKNLEKLDASAKKKKLESKEKNMKKAYVFPGQGSQKKGMGQGLFDEFSDYTRKADAILGYSIKDLCLNDPENKIGQTQFTQPALYTVNVLTYLKHIKDTGEKPDYVAGHSLGEYSALFAAGVFDFETGLKLVQKRGALMSKASGGGMAAVIGLDGPDIDKIINDNGLQSIDVANYNSPGQIVISGIKDDIMNAKSAFENNGAKMYIPLQVSGAFHSRYMADAMNEFKEFLSQFELNKPQIPIISNVRARPYKKSELKDVMAAQITSSVQWIDTIRYLMGKDVADFKELGPGNVLTKLVTKITKESRPLVVEDEVEEVDESPVEAVAETKSGTRTDAGTGKGGEIRPEFLGSEEFRKDYKVKYAYYTGAMVRAIASKEMVVKMGKAGLMGSYGAGGMRLEQVEEDLKYIQSNLNNGESYVMNLLCNLNDPAAEEATVDLFLRYGVTNVEAAAFMQITPAIAKFRAKGLSRTGDGSVEIVNKIIAKVSRPEVAQAFLVPCPERVINKLIGENKITQDEADMLKQVPMADDICVEADSGGHTDMGVAYALMPAMQRLRDDMMAQYKYKKKVRVGAAGGIGAPGSAAAAFIMGADFIVTGSINQCTVESGAHAMVKAMLQDINVQDTAYAPAGDMFEIGARVQVLRKGVFFPARANKLYELYTRHNSLDEIDEKTKKQLQEKYFKKTFDEIWNDTRNYFQTINPAEIQKAERNPKHKMALVFRWYFGYSTRAALNGDEKLKVDFQVHCGPAMGAFNQWVKGTELENWQNRFVDVIAEKLMQETASYLKDRLMVLAS